jgi:tetratricopeptide (TPR) repeat protein
MLAAAPSTALLTPAMLAELARVPLAAVRRWRRRGYLISQGEVHRLDHFAMSEVHVARLLGELVTSGVSLARIDALVDRLATQLTEYRRPLAEAPLVVSDGRLLIRDGDELRDLTGQRQLEFDAEENPAILPFTRSADLERAEPDDFQRITEPRDLAAELDAAGDLPGAIEACRALLLESGGGAEDHFLLAELLYRAGDRSAARERYYAALEVDETYVEARANLGCLLLELGEPELGIAALTGAIEFHPEFPDAHYHLARALDDVGRKTEAAEHWRHVLELAPESPWGDEAAERLG